MMTFERSVAPGDGPAIAAAGGDPDASRESREIHDSGTRITWRRGRFSALARALGALGALGALWLVSGVTFFGYLVASLAVVIGLCTLYQRVLGGKLTAQRFLAATELTWGAELDHSVRLRNRSGIPALARMVDHSTLPGHPRGGVLGVRPRGVVDAPVRYRVQSRGRWRVGPTTVTRLDPLGLFARTELVAPARHILVFPRSVWLRHSALAVEGLRPGTLLGKRRSEQPPDIAGLRDWVEGDGLRRIHWTASLRLGRLISRKYTETVEAAIWLVVDLDNDTAPIHRTRSGGNSGQRAAQTGTSRYHHVPVPVPAGAYGNGDEQRAADEELLVTIAASYADYWLSRRIDLGLIVSGVRPQLHYPQRGERQRDRIREGLALADSAPVAALRAMQAAATDPTPAITSAGVTWTLADTRRTEAHAALPEALDDALRVGRRVGPTSQLALPVRLQRLLGHDIQRGHTVALCTCRSEREWRRTIELLRHYGVAVFVVVPQRVARAAWKRVDLAVPEELLDPVRESELRAVLEGRIIASGMGGSQASAGF